MTSPTVLGYQSDQNLLDALERLYGVRRASFGPQQQARNTYRGAQQGVLNARAGLFGPRAAVRGAQGNVFGQQERQLGLERGYIGMQQGFNAARGGELQALIGARQDTSDIVRTAALSQRRQAYLPRYQAAGIPTTEVDLPEGAESNQPGVFARYQTRYERLVQQQQDVEAQRGLQLDGARLAVAMAGTDVEQARIAAGRAGLTLDEAEDMVARADLGADQANLNYQGVQDQYGDQEQQAQFGVDEARLAGQRADMPPYAGAVQFMNPVTGLGQWVTPQERTYLQQQYGFAQDQLGGDLGSASPSEIQSYLVDGLIDETSAMQELVRRGMTPARAQWEVQQAALQRERRASSGGSGRSLFGEDTGGGGGGGLPSTAQQVDDYLSMLERILGEEFNVGAR